MDKEQLDKIDSESDLGQRMAKLRLFQQSMTIVSLATLLYLCLDVYVMLHRVTHYKYVRSTSYGVGGSVYGSASQNRSDIVYDILLTSYMRSGSTITGKILGFRDDSFYVYEPLHQLLGWRYYRQDSRGDHVLCSLGVYYCWSKYDPEKTHLLSGRNVRPATFERVLTYLNSFYNCELDDMAELFGRRIHMHSEFSGPSWEDFRKCFEAGLKLSVCRPALEKACMRSRHRVAKVLRLGLDSVEPLLSARENLKVLHLFRDPRAIINSALNANWHPLFKKYNDLKMINLFSQALCDKMIHDLTEGKKVAEQFENRFRFVQYEDVMDDSNNKVGALLDFMTNSKTATKNKVVYADEMKHSLKGNDSVLNSSQINEIDARFILTSNYEAVVSEEKFKTDTTKWRRYLPWQVVEQVDSACAGAFDDLGYIRLTDKDQLRNYSLPTVKFPYTFSLL